MIPRQVGEPMVSAMRRDRPGTRRSRGLRPEAWPTVDETADALAMMTADTVLQILKGEGRYYGLGDQHVPEIAKRAIRARRWRTAHPPAPRPAPRPRPACTFNAAPAPPLTFRVPIPVPGWRWRWEDFAFAIAHAVFRCSECGGPLRLLDLEHAITTAANPTVQVYFACEACPRVMRHTFTIPDL